MSQHAERETYADIRGGHQQPRPEEVSNEGASLRILLRAAEIEEPDDSQVLNVVPGLKHQEAHLRPLGHRICVRQIRECDHDEDELERVWLVALTHGFDDLD